MPRGAFVPPKPEKWGQASAAGGRMTHESSLPSAGWTDIGGIETAWRLASAARHSGVVERRLLQGPERGPPPRTADQ